MKITRVAAMMLASCAIGVGGGAVQADPLSTNKCIRAGQAIVAGQTYCGAKWLDLNGDGVISYAEQEWARKNGHAQ